MNSDHSLTPPVEEPSTSNSDQESNSGQSVHHPSPRTRPDFSGILPSRTNLPPMHCSSYVPASSVPGLPAFSPSINIGTFNHGLGMYDSRQSASSTNSEPSESPIVPKVRPCAVCKDKSSGYHYGVSSCEGCKGFFRRTVTKNIHLSLRCHKEGNCIINKSTRNRCQACRYKKCEDVGMSRDAVRNGQHNKKKKGVKPESTTQVQEELTEDQRDLIDAVYDAQVSTSPDSSNNSSSSSSSSTATVSSSVPPQPEGQQQMFGLWDVTSELSSQAIVRIVDFAKKIPGFLNLSTRDQITLLKGGCLEVMMLRLCVRYDPKTDMMVLENGSRMSRDDMSAGGLENLTPTVFKFAQNLKALNIDDREIAMLAAICLISGDRSGLENSSLVELLQERLVEALKHYMRSRRQDQRPDFANLLMLLTDLRSISVKGAERVLNQTTTMTSSHPLAPLLVEMLDRQENVCL